MIERISPWINTTTKCNLICPYCYMDKTNQVMQWGIYEEIERQSHNLVEARRVNKINYRIAGGEPLIATNLWTRFLNNMFRSDPANRHFTADILTNLTMLPEDFLRLLTDYTDRVSVSVSFDGLTDDPVIRPTSRTVGGSISSSPGVFSNLVLLRDKIKGLKINLMTTLTADTSKYLMTTALILSTFPEMTWSISIDRAIDPSDEEINQMVTDLRFAFQYLANHNYDIMNKVSFNNMVAYNLSSGGCSAGKELFAINTDGNIYPCQLVISAPKAPAIGNVLFGDMLVYLEQQELYNCGYNYKPLQQCTNCALHDTCNGGCKLAYPMKIEQKNQICKLIKLGAAELFEASINYITKRCKDDAQL